MKQRRRLSSSFLFSLLFLTITTDTTATQILDQVLKEIASKHNWISNSTSNPNSDSLLSNSTTITKLEVSKFRSGTSHRHDFKIRLLVNQNRSRSRSRSRSSKTDFLFKFPDHVDSWNHTDPRDIPGFLSDLTSAASLGTFRILGPLYLFVSEDHYTISLSLPLNATRSGLKRVLVREGITVEVSGAREISLSYPLDLNFSVSKSVGVGSGRNGFWRFWNSQCGSLVSLRVVGSVALAADSRRGTGVAIGTNLLFKDGVELVVAGRCYVGDANANNVRPVHSLSSTVKRVEGVLKDFIGDGSHEIGRSGYITMSLKAVTLVRFHLELERKVETNKTVWEDWRTKPEVERVWFDVMARVEGGNLKPLMFKKVRPFIVADSISWSSLMSNISFTKFPSLLMPPEALTLDVKW